MTRWEYHIEAWVKDGNRWGWGSDLDGKSQHEGLAELGDLGWELIAVTPYTEEGATCLYDFHFKRKV
jgi:hypothetical protein